jgi:hypothetical protein
VFPSFIRDDPKKSIIGRESEESYHLWDYSVEVRCFASAFLKAFMRVVTHGLVHFKDPSINPKIKRLMLHWGSCKRSAYQAIHKHNLKGNDVKIYCKKNYMLLLNGRYISDAVTEASKIDQERALFGGKKLWNKFLKGLISKKKWIQIRNNTLYSRGEKSHKGNVGDWKTWFS